MAITHARIRLGKQLALMLAGVLVGGYGTTVRNYSAFILEHTHARAHTPLGCVYR